MLNRYAFINSANGLVESIVEMDDLTILEPSVGQTAILLTVDNPVQIGWVYNGGDTFSKMLTDSKIDRIDFMRRFTREETIAMNAIKKEIMYMTVADYSDPAKEYLTVLEIDLQRIDLSPQIDLVHSDTIEALNSLAAAGVITQQRIPEILSY